jgi:hypothetical protein
MTSGSEGELAIPRDVDMEDLRRREKEASADLLEKQYVFACRHDLDPELLRGLRNCNKCHGAAYRWDFTIIVSCDACENTGWEGGYRNMSDEGWVTLSQAYLEWSL